MIYISLYSAEFTIFPLGLSTFQYALLFPCHPASSSSIMPVLGIIVACGSGTSSSQECIWSLGAGIASSGCSLCYLVCWMMDATYFVLLNFTSLVFLLLSPGNSPFWVSTSTITVNRSYCHCDSVYPLARVWWVRSHLRLRSESVPPWGGGRSLPGDQERGFFPPSHCFLELNISNYLTLCTSISFFKKRKWEWFIFSFLECCIEY